MFYVGSGLKKAPSFIETHIVGQLLVGDRIMMLGRCPTPILYHFGEYLSTPFCVNLRKHTLPSARCSRCAVSGARAAFPEVRWVRSQGLLKYPQGTEHGTTGLECPIINSNGPGLYDHASRTQQLFSLYHSTAMLASVFLRKAATC